MMTDTDKEALTRAMEMCEADSGRAAQLAGKIAQGESWEDVAKFAAYVQQGERLRLKPWESPPCCGDIKASAADDTSFPSANRLLLRMLKAGVSQWEPDPIAALRTAEAPLEPCDGEMSELRVR